MRPKYRCQAALPNRRYSYIAPEFGNEPCFSRNSSDNGRAKQPRQTDWQVLPDADTPLMLGVFWPQSVRFTLAHVVLPFGGLGTSSPLFLEAIRAAVSRRAAKIENRLSA